MGFRKDRCPLPGASIASQVPDGDQSEAFRFGYEKIVSLGTKILEADLIIGLEISVCCCIFRALDRVGRGSKTREGSLDCS